MNSTTGIADSTNKATRGKDQMAWSDDVWQMIDQAVNEEIMRSRMGAKFLPSVYVHKKRTTVDADIVVPPVTPLVDPSLSVEEATTKRIQQYMAQIRLSRAQVDAEGEHDIDSVNQVAVNSDLASSAGGPAAGRRPHRASTAVSLALQAAKLLGQVEDLVLFNGASSVAYHPLFTSNLVQALDPNLLTNLDAGLLSILPSSSNSVFTPLTPNATPLANVVQLPATQVVLVHPTAVSSGGSLPRYAENSLNAVAEGVSILQGLGYNDNYALVLYTVPYADLHEALTGTLIQPIEPISHLVTAGVFGTGNLPPFPLAAAVNAVETAVTNAAAKVGATGTTVAAAATAAATTAAATQVATVATNASGATATVAQVEAAVTEELAILEGLPNFILTPSTTAGSNGSLVGTSSPPVVTSATNAGTAIAAISSLSGFNTTANPGTQVLYTGFLVSLSGNSMDVVRGLMDDGLDVCLTFNQKSANESYIFNEAQRLTLRLKDQNAVVALFFLDA
jgi:hypothetical protein